MSRSVDSRNGLSMPPTPHAEGRRTLPANGSAPAAVPAPTATTVTSPAATTATTVSRRHTRSWRRDLRRVSASSST